NRKLLACLVYLYELLRGSHHLRHDFRIQLRRHLLEWLRFLYHLDLDALNLRPVRVRHRRRSIYRYYLLWMLREYGAVNHHSPALRHGWWQPILKIFLRGNWIGLAVDFL